MAFTGWPTYRSLRKALPGLEYIAWGLVFFAAGMAISLAKAGLVAKWRRRRQKGEESPSAVSASPTG